MMVEIRITLPQQHAKVALQFRKSAHRLKKWSLAETDQASADEYRKQSDEKWREAKWWIRRAIGERNAQG